MVTTTPGESIVYVKASEPVRFSLQKLIIKTESFPGTVKMSKACSYYIIDINGVDIFLLQLPLW